MVMRVLADVWVEEVIDISSGMFAIGVWVKAAINVLLCAFSGVNIGAMSDICVEVLTEANVNVLVAVMTAL